jgi:hypothetical protein
MSECISKAEQFAAACGNDGLDMYTFHAELDARGMERLWDDQRAEFRIVFEDGSAICTSANRAAWDIEFPGHAWRWESEGPNP